MKRAALGWVLLGVAVLASAALGYRLGSGSAVDPHTIVFVVLDTVRAENLSMCGYERPTSPFLERLRGEAGVSSSCGAVTPGTWTVASHASYFTGLTVPQHGIVKHGIPLSEEPTTLAERLRARGYRTALVSGNGVLHAMSGLQRGFEHARVPPPKEQLRGRELVGAVAEAVDAFDPAEPLFLFVNIIDAHDPYPRIGPEVGWVPPQGEVHLHEIASRRTDPYRRFLAGELTADESRAWLERVRNGYDQGISHADRVLREVFELLEDRGRLALPHRWVITSDHGEFLGEHGNLRHGCFVYEEVTRVPFLVRDTTRARPIELPEVLSATSAYDLLLGRKVRDRLPASVSERRKPSRPSADMVGVWASPTEKLVWQHGEWLRFDLAVDPDEEAPQPLGAHPLRPELEELAADHQRALRVRREISPRYAKMLEELGYAD